MTQLLKLELIETDVVRGKGTEESPMRRCMQLFTTDGTLVFEYDPHEDKVSMTANLLAHLKWIS
jgi:hypothetical protein